MPASREPHRAGVKLVPRLEDGVITATVTGVFDSGAWPQVRDGLLAMAAEAPDGLIADIDGLSIEDEVLVSVFVLVAIRIGTWPAIPFAVVSHRPDHRAMLASRTLDRVLPVHEDVTVATRLLLARPQQPRAVQQLAPSSGSSALTREFVLRVCTAWALPDLVWDAQVIATELVENVLRHTDSSPALRLESRPGVLSIAVSDGDSRPAVLLRQGGRFLGSGLGLRIVAERAKVWGCSRGWSGGKTVWAVLARHTLSSIGLEGE